MSNHILILPAIFFHLLIQIRVIGNKNVWNTLIPSFRFIQNFFLKVACSLKDIREEFFEGHSRRPFGPPSRSHVFVGECAHHQLVFPSFVFNVMDFCVEKKLFSLGAVRY